MHSTAFGRHALPFAAALLLSVSLANPTAAQVRFGVDAGLSRSTLSGDLDDADARTGLRIGGHLIAPLSGALSLQAGATFVQKGASQRVDFSDVGGGSGDLELQLDYFEIPLLARADFGTGPVRAHLLAGPALAFEVGCAIDATVSEGGTEVNVSTDCSDDDFDLETESVDLGLLFGGGLTWAATSRLDVGAQLGYNVGLRNIDASAEGGEVNNRALYAGLTLTLRR